MVLRLSSWLDFAGKGRKYRHEDNERSFTLSSWQELSAIGTSAGRGKIALELFGRLQTGVADARHGAAGIHIASAGGSRR